MAKKKVPTPAKPKEPKKTLREQAEGRAIAFPEVVANVCTGENALTVQQMKDLLGWEEETEGSKLAEHHFVDRLGHKVFCHNNVTNRPLYMSSVDTLVQEHLMKRWKFNGEPIIVGKTGLILNGQHTLISGVFAEQERTGDNAEHWKEIWGDSEIVIEKMVVFGVDEDDTTVNTMDTCKPRSIADVIYRSKYFAEFTTSNRKIVARIMDYAIRLLWQRTGAGVDPFAPRRTHAEALDFLDRHPRLIDSVKHIYEEDQQKTIRALVSPGFAAALLYLMSCSTSDGETYQKERNENVLAWDNEAKASEFWVLLASPGSEHLKPVRHAIGRLMDPEHGGGSATVWEKIAIIIKGWLHFVSQDNKKEFKPITPAILKLKYKPVADDGTGGGLDECPLIGGIDLGSPDTENDEDESEETNGDTVQPTPEEVEAKKLKIREEAKAKILAARAATNGEQRQPGEVEKPAPHPKSADGKPPAPKLLPQPAHKRPTPKPVSQPIEKVTEAAAAVNSEVDKEVKHKPPMPSTGKKAPPKPKVPAKK